MSSKNQKERVEISRNIHLVKELEAMPKPVPVEKPAIREPLQRLSNTIGEAFQEAQARLSEK